MADQQSTRPKRIRMDRDERRNQILCAAMKLFKDRAYSGVSVSDIADEAGIARGLLHHYFGSKRELYLEVVREVAAMPKISLPDGPDSLDTTQLLDRTIDTFLGVVGHNREHWLTSVRVGGAERDDEVASILDESREVLADGIIDALGLGHRAAEPALRAIVRGYGGYVQELTVEWLERGRLDRQQVRTAMAAALPMLIEQVLPLVEEA